MPDPSPLRADQRTLHGRVERQVGSLMVLARRWPQYESDPQRACNAVSEAASSALEVERCSIWILDPDGSAMVCQELYEASRHRHSRGFRLTRDSAPAYFLALQTEGWIQAVDAHSDPRTAALAGSYLVPHGIGALVDVPIRVGGQVAGVLRAEHAGGPRTFQSDELTSLAFLGMLVALALESQRAREAREALGQERALVNAALEATGAAVLVLDQSGGVRFYNRKLLELWHMPEKLMGPAGGNGIRIQHIASQTTDPARFIARFRRLSAEPEQTSTDTVTLTDGRVIERSSSPQMLGGGTVGRAWSFRVVSAAPASG